ncbi:DNA primase [Rhizorhapis sp. SPR117]|uniref:DNA primase n=1 Tax=Rhizorhapis sp. SPR117 TaxID=2912611 RepID=UPI001F000FD5|nr:DNA primase [Rhizorhapis sp. SPR117]
MSLSPQFLDELRARTTLSTLIGKTVKVQKAGREYKACCPFHNEKTPSFTINDEKGFYHCFGCGAHGDVISWMTEQRGLPFMDAVKELAATAGLDVPAPDPKAARRAEEAATLHDVMGAAQDWFVEQLQNPNGAQAREYLKRRGISDSTAKAFGFGLSPDGRSRLKEALKGHGESRLIEAGLLIDPDASEPDGGKSKKRDSYDRFRGRLMIPIRDPRGRVIAFGGRILGTGEPKYLNSPDTPLFDKGRTLYNLDRASPAARQTGRVIVVEGYMDVVALAQAGFGETVAPLGTALTEHQIERLWKMVEVPILCFDGDAAGQKAAIRAAMRALPLLRPGHSLAFATLPTGQDPDDLIRNEGAAAFEAIVSRAQPLVERLWTYEVANGPLETPEQQAGLKQRFRDIVAQIGHDDIRRLYGQAFRERLDELLYRRRPNSFPQPWRDRQKWQKKGFRPAFEPAGGEARAISGSGMEGILLRGVLSGLIRYPMEIRAHLEELSHLRIADSQMATLMEFLLSSAMTKEILDTDALLTILGQSELYNMARGLLRADALNFTFTRKDADPGRACRDLGEAIRVMVAGPEIESALTEATRRMGEAFDEASFAQQQKLREMKAEHEQRLADLMQPDDNL